MRIYTGHRGLRDLNVLDFGGFMFFSTFEGLAVFALTLYIFRYNFKQYIGPSLIAIELVNFQNYLIREELSLAAIAPILNIIITVLFIITVARVPIIWAMIMTVTGYTAFVFMQSVIFIISFGYLSASLAESVTWIGYLVQFLSGILGVLIGFSLYRRGLGFAFSFDKLKFKWEQAMVIVIILGFIIGVGVMMFFKDVYLNLFVLLICLFFFLYYSFRKEVDEP
jgi:hypothetical protein